MKWGPCPGVGITANLRPGPVSGHVRGDASDLDGRLGKIGEELALEYGRPAWMKPWRVRTVVTEGVDLAFEPEFERVGRSGRREGWSTEVHQMFGRYSGRVVPDGGPPIEALMRVSREHPDLLVATASQRTSVSGDDLKNVTQLPLPAFLAS